jgi:ABC-type Na+ efflux pump permease subunit
LNKALEQTEITKTSQINTKEVNDALNKQNASIVNQTNNTQQVQPQPTTNQIQTPVMLFLMTGYMLSIFAAMFKGSVLLKAMALVPFVSGILAPVMFMLGEITLLEISISILLLVGVIFLLYKYGLRVYKVGILNYSSSNLWKKIFNALKQRD